jgi:hypothetical protein
MRTRGRKLVPALGIAAVLSACGGSSISPPPADAAPDVVVRAYLEALVRGDCSAEQVLGTGRFMSGSGELCGHTTVKSYSLGGTPATPTPDEAVFATTLVTTGTSDGSVQPGDLIWFFDLIRQPDGSWRIAGGGSGP